MRALKLPGPGKDTQVQEVEQLPAGPAEVRVKVDVAFLGARERGNVIGRVSAGVPGRSLRWPLTLGYQGTGLVDEAGEAAALEVGARVFINGYMECGACQLCRIGEPNLCPNYRLLGLDRDGCLADYVTLPARHVWPITLQVPTEIIPGLSQIGTVMHGFRRLGKLSGKDMLIIGAGDIGLTAGALAALAGVASLTMVDPAEPARSRAKDLVPSARILTPEESRGDTFDVVFEISGSAAGIQSAFDSLRPGGIAILYSAVGPLTLSFDQFFQQLVWKEVTILGTNGKTPKDLSDAEHWLASHESVQRLFRLEQRPLADAPQLLSDMVAGNRQAPVCIMIDG